MIEQFVRTVDVRPSLATAVGTNLWHLYGDHAPQVMWFSAENPAEVDYVGRWGCRDWPSFAAPPDLLGFRIDDRIALNASLADHHAIDVTDLLLDDARVRYYADRQVSDVRRSDLDQQLSTFHHLIQGVVS